MNTQQRADQFALYVALELKGKITTMGYTANQVADMIGRPRATMNRWLNGKLPLPISVLGEASEAIDVDPQLIVGTAYDRLCVELGERDGTTYDDEPGGDLITGQFGVVTPGQDEPEVKEPPARLRNAAKRGRRKADMEPHAE